MTNKRNTIITDLDSFEERCDEILSDTSYEYVKDVISRLKDALYSNKGVAALCAPQIGEHARIFAVRNGHKDQDRFKVFLNPIVVSAKGLHLSREVSPSLPNKEFIIPRRDEVHVAYQLADGHVNSESFTGAYAEVVQQMIEMLDGITLRDYGLDLDDLGGAKAFDKAPQKDKVAVISMYLENIKNTCAALKDEIANDPILSALDKSIEFNKGVLLGDIKPLSEEDMPPELRKHEGTGQ